MQYLFYCSYCLDRKAAYEKVIPSQFDDQQIQQYKAKLEKASSIITKANAMKHEFEKLQEEMKVKDQEVIFS